jgi:TolB-like protein/DNA-binding winged helix-turn-helix (wHTH) protein
MTEAAGFPHAHEPAGDGPRIARFGTFEADVRAGELRRDGVRVRLQEQPFRMLAFLLERAADVVTRAELRERLWPTEFVDFDHSLNTAVRKLRAALDDDADNPRFIETVARRGYRFIAPVEWQQQPPLPLAGEGGAQRRVRVALVAALILIATVTLTVFRARQTPLAQPIVSLAVLPFTTDNAQNEHIADGVTEVLIDNLSLLPNLRVMARTTVFEYKGKRADAKRAGSELNVNAIVTGHVRRAGDRYTIRAELIDSRDGAQLWGESFETPAAELAIAQTRLAARLSQRLGSPARTRRALTTNAEAYDLYLRGMHAWNRRGKDDLDRALHFFTRATQLDPSFAAAYAGLANTYGVMVGYGIIPVAEGAPKVLAAAQKALEIDPDNAEALVSIATTKYRNIWDFPGAERDYQRALVINPNYATGHQWYSDYLRSFGRFEEARKQMEIAYKLDLLSQPVNAVMCWTYFNERRYEEAIAFARQSAKLDRRFAAPACTISSLIALDRYDDALNVWRDFYPAAGEKMTEAYRKGGRRAFFLSVIDALKGTSSEFDRPVETAVAYAALGMRDEAFQWLETAYRNRTSRITSFHLHPAFDEMRDDPRFQDLLKRIGLPDVRPPAATGSTAARR